MDNGCRPSQCGDIAGRINQYALVAYIGGKLGEFLLNLRQEIVPGCNLRSHVSILPPRPLAGTEAAAADFVQCSSRIQPAFLVGLDEVEVFPITNVIYIAVGVGLPDLHRMHGALNADSLQYAEPFAYHPHITLAQEIPAADHAAALALCQSRWREYSGPRNFPVETLTFVQNTTSCGWVDLSEAHLEMAGSRL